MRLGRDDVGSRNETALRNDVGSLHSIASTILKSEFQFLSEGFLPCRAPSRLGPAPRQHPPLHPPPAPRPQASPLPFAPVVHTCRLSCASRAAHVRLQHHTCQYCAISHPLCLLFSMLLLLLPQQICRSGCACEQGRPREQRASRYVEHQSILVSVKRQRSE